MHRLNSTINRFIIAADAVKPADYGMATQRVLHTLGDASFISLPVMPK